MILKYHSSVAFLVFTLTANQLFAQDQQALARRDSLSRTGSRHICVSNESFLIDSVLVVNTYDGNKVQRLINTKSVSLIRLHRDSSIFYLASDKTIILNGKELVSKNMPVSIENKLYRKIKPISASRLLKDYKIVNKNGAIVFTSR